MFTTDLLNTADVLSSTTAGGEVRVQIGEAAEGVGITGDVAVWGSDGFISRPNDPSPTGACQVLYGTEGNSKRCLAARDNRFIQSVGELQPGDRAIVSDCPARIFLKKATQAIALYTEDKNVESGKSMVLSLDGDTGKITIANGKTSIVLSHDKISFMVSGGAVLELTGDGKMRAFGTNCALAFGGGSLGMNPGGSPAIPPVQSIICGVSGMTGVPSTGWTVGI